MPVAATCLPCSLGDSHRSSRGPYRLAGCTESGRSLHLLSCLLLSRKSIRVLMVAILE